MSVFLPDCLDDPELLDDFDLVDEYPVCCDGCELDHPPDDIIVCDGCGGRFNEFCFSDHLRDSEYCRTFMCGVD